MSLAAAVANAGGPQPVPINSQPGFAGSAGGNLGLAAAVAGNAGGAPINRGPPINSGGTNSLAAAVAGSGGGGFRVKAHNSLAAAVATSGAIPAGNHDYAAAPAPYGAPVQQPMRQPMVQANRAPDRGRNKEWISDTHVPRLFEDHFTRLPRDPYNRSAAGSRPGGSQLAEWAANCCCADGVASAGGGPADMAKDKVRCCRGWVGLPKTA